MNQDMKSLGGICSRSLASILVLLTFGSLFTDRADAVVQGISTSEMIPLAVPVAEGIAKTNIHYSGYFNGYEDARLLSEADHTGGKSLTFLATRKLLGGVTNAKPWNYLEEASRLGDSHATSILALAFEFGVPSQGIQVDVSRAAKMMRRASSEFSRNAMNKDRMADFLERNPDFVVTQDEIMLLRHAAQAENLRKIILSLIGEEAVLPIGSQNRQIKRLLEMAVLDDRPETAWDRMQLSDMLSHGGFLAAIKDSDIYAFQLKRNLLDIGLQPAWLQTSSIQRGLNRAVAIHLTHGIGTEADEAAALPYIRAAAMHDDVDSLVTLTKYYIQGAEGVSRDIDRAVHLAKPGALAGVSDLAYLISVCFHQVDWHGYDPATGFAWLQIAVEDGSQHLNELLTEAISELDKDQLEDFQEALVRVRREVAFHRSG